MLQEGSDQSMGAAGAAPDQALLRTSPGVWDAG